MLVIVNRAFRFGGRIVQPDEEIDAKDSDARAWNAVRLTRAKPSEKPPPEKPKKEQPEGEPRADHESRYRNRRLKTDDDG